ncbi:NHL repeat [Dillenia turbinata]|uniref:NHL repeat n=1 Tax=Dillenia turbinata TaxID=194707 RepID=A0AAN8Z0S1_9MAGN
MASHFFLFSLSLSLLSFVFFTFNHVTANLILEEGYTVTTLIDGNKLNINPYSILPFSQSHNFVILDSLNSVFYALSFQNSQDSEIKKLSGKGEMGFSDGDLESAKFDKPKSFAVDDKGNVYVADRRNHAIRKIGLSGVTTIAGGYSRSAGHVDGPAQNASFSDDFELTFAPKRCALLISDHGNKLIRQINLKSEDCKKDSHSVSRSTTLWVLGLGISCLFGLLAGLALRPYVIPSGGFSALQFNKTWKHCLINLGRQVLILCFDIRNAVASSAFYMLLRRLALLSLSHVSLMFRTYIVGSQTMHRQSVSLIDSDDSSGCKLMQSEVLANQLKDLIGFDGFSESNDPNMIVTQLEDETHNNSLIDADNSLIDANDRINAMMQANLLGFMGNSTKTNILEDAFMGSSGLMKRR